MGYHDDDVSKVSKEIMALSSHVDGYAHKWGEETGPRTTCQFCGKQKRETIGGCLINAAIHRADAPEALRKTLSFVRPTYRADDLYHLPFNQYMAARWKRNAEAIQLLGLGLDREYCEKIRLKWAEEYWAHRAEVLQGVLTEFHDLFSEIVEDGRALFRDNNERAKVLQAFVRSNSVLA